MKILAIDPGTTESAYVIMDSETYKPLHIGKVDNDKLLDMMFLEFLFVGEKTVDKVVIEMVASYGMAVGQTVFETCVWIGRFKQLAITQRIKVEFVYRKEVKMNLCGQMKAKDSNIIQALVDRFAYNVPNRGKGYKKSPAFFYGFKADIWQAFALGVSYLDSVEIEIVEII
jgi:hypothetical protein